MYSSCCCNCFNFCGSKLHACGKELVPVVLACMLSVSFLSKNTVICQFQIYHLILIIIKTICGVLIHVKLICHILDLAFLSHYHHVCLNVLRLDRLTGNTLSFPLMYSSYIQGVITCISCDQLFTLLFFIIEYMNFWREAWWFLTITWASFM